MHLNELKALHVSEVLKQAEDLEIENTGRMRKQELMFAIIKKRARAGEQIFADGVLEILPDGFGFLRSPDTSYTASTDDIYISPSQVRRFNLHTGDMIEGEVRTPKDGERYFALNKLEKVNGGGPEENKHKVMFENLTPLFPKEQMRLERDIKGDENITGRIIDIIAPIGKGQRALLVAPPKSGKTVMMQHIAHAISANYPNSHMMVLLVDERPAVLEEQRVTSTRSPFIEERLQNARSRGWRLFPPERVAPMRERALSLDQLLRSLGMANVQISQQCIRSLVTNGCMAIFIDDFFFGPFNFMSINVRDIEFIAIIGPTEAISTYGNRAQNGVVMLYTARSQDRRQPRNP